jgi:hypothetical protein
MSQVDKYFIDSNPVTTKTRFIYRQIIVTSALQLNLKLVE